MIDVIWEMFSFRDNDWLMHDDFKTYLDGDRIKSKTTLKTKTSQLYNPNGIKRKFEKRKWPNI